MRERPILFSGPMVRAILAGRKTQTRRLVKAPHAADAWIFDGALGLWESGIEADYGRLGHGEYVRCPYGVPGDRLWVRETWYCDVPHDDPDRDEHLYYRADGEARDQFEQLDPPNIRLWKPSIHMPRWASRLTLDVTGVRVERLQDISEEDARGEGVTPFAHDPEGDCWTAQPPERKHRAAFEYLWGEINGWQGEPRARAPWASNPWVWVVEFTGAPRERWWAR